MEVVFTDSLRKEEMLGVEIRSVLSESHCPLPSTESLEMTGVPLAVCLVSRVTDRQMRHRRAERSILTEYLRLVKKAF